MIIENEVSRFDKAGNFYIDLRPYAHDVCLKYSSWESGFNIFRWNNSIADWVPENNDPDLPLLNYFNLNIEKLPINDFVKTFPLCLVHAISKFNYLQTTLLQLSARDIENIDRYIIKIPNQLGFLYNTPVML